MTNRYRGWLLGLLLGSVFAPPAGAALIDRGNGLIYDDVLDITWQQNASLGGGRNWNNAVAWADSLVFGGFDDWRLPSMDVNDDGTVVDCSGASETACRDNELGYMYYWNLTPVTDTPPTDVGTDLTGNQTSADGVDLLNIVDQYWSGTEFAPMAVDAWHFQFDSGDQNSDPKPFDFYAAWAVRPGDVPIPAALPLFASALAGLGFFGWRCSKRV